MPHRSPHTLRARTLRTGTEFRAAAQLYTRVFGYDCPEFSLNLNLLSALARNGGSAVGVYSDEDDLIGFAYGFAGRDETGDDFHYSQAAVVDRAHQGDGIGRMLKEGQREVARAWGHRTMRWTYDPLLARNAHFNLSSLGAEGVAFVPDYYGRPGTDRIVVQWALDRDDDPFGDLRRATPPRLGREDWGHVRQATVHRANGDAVTAHWLALPSELPSGADESDEAAQARVREALIALLHGGHTLIACLRTDDETAAYLAVPTAPTLASDTEEPR